MGAARRPDAFHSRRRDAGASPPRETHATRRSHVMKKLIHSLMILVAAFAFVFVSSTAAPLA
ncbi:MAG: hypothetical protein V3U53_01340, partial [bacterium]